MSEAEILEIILELQCNFKQILKDDNINDYIKYITSRNNNAIQGLLYLYKEEKDKNASLQKEIKLMKSININDNYISKDKIRKEKENIEEMLFKEKTQITKLEFSYAIGVLEELLEEA